MKKNKYTITRVPFNTRKSGMQTTYRSKMDFGTIDELSKINEYIIGLLEKESENIKKLGLNPESITITIEQL